MVVIWLLFANKRQRKPKWQLRMDNPQKPTTLDTQDMELIQTKQETWISPKTRGEPR